MDRKEIQNMLDSAYSKADYHYLFLRAEKEQDFFNTIWEMSDELPAKDAWRLLWVLDHATEKNNSFLLPVIDEIYRKVALTENESYIRIGLKLILRCPLNEEYIAGLLDRCIEWMNKPKAKISSQALGLEFFFQVCKFYPEMAPELAAYIDDILERSPSPGFIIRLKTIRNELGKLL